MARALVQNPKLLLTDEPTGALDSQNTNSLMDLFETLNTSGMTIIVVPHNIAVAQRTPISYSIIDGVLQEERGRHSA